MLMRTAAEQKVTPPLVTSGRLDSTPEKPLDRLNRLFQAQLTAYQQEPDTPFMIRCSRLDRLLKLIETHEADFIAAINADFQSRAPQETRLAELLVVRGSLLHARRHLKKWMRVRSIRTGLQFLPGVNRLMPQPLGVVGILSPWNYPLQLSLGPAIAALAAGNRVLIKPSELTPRFSELLERLVHSSFASDEMAVVNGGPDVGAAFSRLPFHHLFFTGSTAVGRIVGQAAAANLTPVTLELGGKSPVIIDSSADQAKAAHRIAFGKLLNAGQTCVAPDYLLVPTGTAEQMASHLVRAMSKMYPSLNGNRDYSAIATERHWQRLRSLVDEAVSAGARVIEVNPANERFDGTTRKFPPTLVLNPSLDLKLMQEEIFGPILPILEVDSLDQAIQFVNERERPLALYWFGTDTASRNRVLHETISGGVTINDCLWHLAQEEQPFGGVGHSGHGVYHGEWGFRTFSQEKPVFYPSDLSATWLLHPPYGKVFNVLHAILKKIV